MNELYHHGVNGQKWGVRNGPPYPLDSEGKAKVRAQRDGKNTGRKSGSMSIAIGLGLAAAFEGLVFGGSYLLQKHHNKKVEEIRKKIALTEMRQYYDNTINYDGALQKLSDVKQCKPNPKHDESVVNDSNNSNKKGRTQNCVNCAIAWEMRQRGLDVVARRTDEPLNATIFNNVIRRSYRVNERNDFSDLYVSNTRKKYETIRNDKTMNEAQKSKALNELNDKTDKEVRKAIFENSGNNSRGYFVYDLEGLSMSHVINYEIKNGKVTFYDSQDSNRNMDKNIKKLYQYMSFDDYYESRRLDNVEIDEGDMQHVMIRK